MVEVFSQELPDSEIIPCPLADGGEGTHAVLTPFLADEQSLIESARFIGLNLPQMQSLDILNRGSSSLGDTIISGLDAGKREFVIGLGGTATNDGGLGMLMALGIKAFNEQGREIEPNLSGLLSLHSIDISTLDPRLAKSHITILSDVESPLCGKNGATTVYGPQKGLQASDVERVDDAFSVFADLCADAFGVDPRWQAGAGAAGGVGFVLMLLGGEMVSGAGYVMDRTGFHDQLNSADWVITGEGRSDAQTLQGKLPVKVAKAARVIGAKAVLISGSVDRDALSELEKQFDWVIGAKPDNMNINQAIEQAEIVLAHSAALFSGTLKEQD